MREQKKTRGRSKSEQKRLQILEAATRLYLGQGVHATSMEQIAEQADVSKQTLYSHFGGKDELFVAAIEQKCLQYELSSALFESKRPIKTVLFELAKHLLELLLSQDAIKLHRLCISGGEQYPSVCRLYYQAGPKNLTELFEGYLKRQIAEGYLQIGNTAYAAQQFLSMVKGDAYMKALLDIDGKQNIDDQEDYINSCVAMFIKAYQSN